MPRPHIRIPSSGPQDAQFAATPPGRQGDSDNQANSEPDENSPEEHQRRIERIRRKLEDGSYLTREAAEEAARQLRESGDL